MAIASPADGAIFKANGSVNIAATASGANGIKSIIIMGATATDMNGLQGSAAITIIDLK